VTLVEATVSSNGRTRRRSVVPVSIEFGTALAPLAAAPTIDEFRGLVAAELTVILERLGIGGEAAVSIGTAETRRPVRVSVHGCFQPYPPTLVRRAWLATAPPGMQELSTASAGAPELGFPNRWLEDFARGPDADPGLLLAFAARLVQAIVFQRPSCLLVREQVVRYAAQIALDPDDLGLVLGPLLDMGVGVSDHALIREVVQEGRELARPREDTVEAAFTKLRSHVVELLVHPETLR